MNLFSKVCKTLMRQNENKSSELSHNIMHTLCTMAHLSQPDIKHSELFPMLPDYVSAMNSLTHEE